MEAMHLDDMPKSIVASQTCSRRNLMKKVSISWKCT